MEDKKKVAALIVNWNGAHDTIELIDSLLSCRSEWLSLTIVVIDNASVVDDRKRLVSAISERNGRATILYRQNATNVGVPSAYNQAMQVVGLDHDYYLRLDNDVVLKPDCIIHLISAIQANTHRNVHIVGGYIKCYDSPNLDNGGSVSINLLAGQTKVTYPDHDVVCDGVLGCIMLFTKDLACHYAPDVFDPSLFICTDESELSLRAAKDGFNTYYVSRLIGYHKSGRSTRKVSLIAGYFSSRNWTFLRLRYSNGWWTKTRILISFAVGSLKALLRGRTVYPRGVISGLLLYSGTSMDERVRLSIPRDAR